MIENHQECWLCHKVEVLSRRRIQLDYESSITVSICPRCQHFEDSEIRLLMDARPEIYNWIMASVDDVCRLLAD